MLNDEFVEEPHWSKEKLSQISSNTKLS